MEDRAEKGEEYLSKMEAVDMSFCYTLKTDKETIE